VLALRQQLTEQGLDAGADRIGWHLQHHQKVTVSLATIHRILTGRQPAAPGLLGVDRQPTVQRVTGRRTDTDLLQHPQAVLPCWSAR
jgi:hypothetical protein